MISQLADADARLDVRLPGDGPTLREVDPEVADAELVVRLDGG